MLWKDAQEAWLANIGKEKRLGFVWAHREIDDNIYCLPEWINACCMIDEKKEELVPVIDGNFGQGRYSAFLKLGDNYYFAPARAEHIMIYYPEEQIMKYIPFDEPSGKINFGGMIAGNKKVYFLPVNYPHLIILDIETEEIEYYRDCFKNWKLAEEEIYVGGAIQDDKKVIIASRLTNQIAELDLENGAIEQLGGIGPEDTDCCAIIKEADGIYWLFPWKSKKIRCWNRATGDCEIIDEYPEDFICKEDKKDKEKYMYVTAKKIGGYIWLFYAYGNMILRLNLSTRRLEEIPSIRFWDGGKEDWRFDYLKRAAMNGIIRADNDGIVLISAEDNGLITINITNFTIKRKHYMVKGSEPLKPLAEIIEESDNIAWENTINATLNDYLDYVVHGKILDKKGENVETESAGQKIYKSVMNDNKEIEEARE